jgi:hypothetical protein
LKINEIHCKTSSVGAAYFNQPQARCRLDEAFLFRGGGVLQRGRACDAFKKMRPAKKIYEYLHLHSHLSMVVWKMCGAQALVL